MHEFHNALFDLFFEDVEICYVLKVDMTRNFLSPSWKDLLKLYSNFFCSFLISFLLT